MLALFCANYMGIGKVGENMAVMLGAAVAVVFIVVNRGKAIGIL